METRSDKYTVISVESLRELGLAILAKVGISREESEITIDSLIDADLRGVHSHGINRLLWYVDRLIQGGTNPRPNVRVIKDTAGIAVIDGDNGLGQVVSKRAVEIALAKAQRVGVGIVGVRNSHHHGACAYWAKMALSHDMVGIVITNGGPIMAPWGGLTPSLSNDPVSIAIPAGQERPIVLDMATSIVAGGKLDVAISKGEKIPLGWALNKNGEPTEDPREARKGLMLPIANYKGYILTVVFEVLVAVLTGANFAKHVTRPSESAIPMGIGHFFQAINISDFMPVDEFEARVDDLIHQMKSSRLAPGYDRIYLPGELEEEKRVQYLKNGIPMVTKVIQELNDLVSRL